MVAVVPALSKTAEVMSASANTMLAPEVPISMRAACAAVGVAIFSSNVSDMVPAPSSKFADCSCGATVSGSAAIGLSEAADEEFELESLAAPAPMSSCGVAMAMTACLSCSDSVNETVAESAAVVRTEAESATPPEEAPASRT